MTTSVRSKTTIPFCLKKMVILLESWRGNIVAKIFTTIGPKSWLMNVLRNSWENLGNSSQEIPRTWFWRTFLWNSREFPQILSAELVTRKFLELVTRNSSDLVPRNGLREIPRKSCRHFRQIFLFKNLRKFPGRIPGNFRGFSAKLLLGMCLVLFIGTSNNVIQCNFGEKWAYILDW